MKESTLVINGPFFREWYYTETTTRLRFLKLNRDRQNVSGLLAINKQKRLNLEETYTKYCERKGYND